MTELTQDAKWLWRIALGLYLFPLLYVAGDAVFAQIIKSVAQCEVNAAQSYPCVIRGHDYGPYLYSQNFLGYTLALFVLPWCVIGAVLLMLWRFALIKSSRRLHQQASDRSVRDAAYENNPRRDQT